MKFNVTHLKNKNEIIDLAEFVVKENFNHHKQGQLSSNYKNDLLEIYNEEMKFFNNSNIFISRNSKNEINGSIRVLNWNYKDILPIEKIFKIKPLDIIQKNSIKYIWHIGRFAIKKNITDISLFKKLMVAALTPVCKHENSVVFAECDSKLLRIMNILGIQTIQVGEPINYLGSETIPIHMYFEGLISFYKKHEYLLSYDFTNSLNETQKYSF